MSELAGNMPGYTPDEKLRLQQLRELRRRWLRDQELSPREPVLPPRKMWPLEGFWNNFLRDGALWKNVVSSHAGLQPGHPDPLLSVPSRLHPVHAPENPKDQSVRGLRFSGDCHLPRVPRRALESRRCWPREDDPCLAVRCTEKSALGF